MVLKYGGVLTHAGRKQVLILSFKSMLLFIMYGCDFLPFVTLQCLVEGHKFICSRKCTNVSGGSFITFVSVCFRILQAEELGRYFRNNMYPG